MPAIVEIRLDGPVDVEFKPDWVHGLAADWIETGWSSEQHQAPKPYAVSLPFKSPEGLLTFRLRLLDDAMVESCRTAANVARASGVRLGSTTYGLVDVSLVDQRTLAELAAGARAARSHTFQFLTPTFFRSGTLTLPLPVPTSVFHSLQRSWTVAALAVGLDPPEARFPLLQMTELDIHTARLPHHQRHWIGFVGTVSIEVDRSATTDERQLVHALTHLAPYSGVGAHTQFGAGEVSVSSI